jgi:membrane protein implicated in regulation of membrane protease activity
MLISLLADILAVDALVRLWANPLPLIWWQILLMLIGTSLFRVLFKISARRNGRKSSISQNLGLLALCNKLGLVVISLVSMLP